MFRTFLLALVSLVSVAAAAEPTWALSTIKVTTLCGVSATSPNEVFAAMGDNSLGPGMIHSTDKAATYEYVGPAGGLNMDIAFTPDGKVGCMATVSGLLLTQDGKTFTKAAGLTGVTQNVEAFGTQSLAATGSFYNKNTKKNANGVAVSTDGGNVWNTYDIGLNSSYIARYGAFPSDSTWYVSSGSWPAASNKLENDISYKLTQHINIQESGKAETQFAPFGKPTKKVNLGGYPGGISKTTDAGKTWTQVFDSEGSMYFNEIHCFDAEHCMAVAENESGAYGVASSNGGKTWTTVLESEGGSLMGCRMLSQTEAWMSGGGSTKSGLTGFYYHTTDAGKTWTNTQVPQAYSMDLSFNGGVGYSAALNNGFSSIAVYN